MKTRIAVSVVYAEKNQQWLEELEVARGSSVADVINASGMLEKVPALKGQQVVDLDLGVFAHRVGSDTLVEEGDRVEIYRPLTADPKEVRRQLAKLGKTIGSQNRG